VVEAVDFPVDDVVVGADVGGVGEGAGEVPDDAKSAGVADEEAGSEFVIF
jgi:hypothetical protein